MLNERQKRDKNWGYSRGKDWYPTFMMNMGVNLHTLYNEVKSEMYMRKRKCRETEVNDVALFG